MRVRAWLERNEIVLKAVAACVVAVSAGMWAVVELLYEDRIKPTLQAPKLQTEVVVHEVGRTAQYTVHTVTFKLTNRGLNRIYLPSSYFVARAYNVINRRTRNNEQKSEEEKENANKFKDASMEILKTMPEEKRLALKAQAYNYLINNEWTELLAKNGLAGKTDLRSTFDFDPDSCLYVQLGRLTGFTEFLDPGDVTESQVLVYVPLGYQALEIINSTVFSKDADVFSKYVFIGVPDYKKGLFILELDGSKPTNNQIKSLKEIVANNLKSEFYSELDEHLKNSKKVYRDTRRVQVFIAPAQQGVPADHPASASLRQDGG